MALAPVHRLRKDEIIWLGSHKCKAHSHTYLEHYNCWLKEHSDDVKIGFWDIESSNLKANYGIMLSYCIKVKDKDEILYRAITKKEALSKDKPDLQVVRQCIEDLKKFDLIYTFYGDRFDWPFCRTRAKMLGLEFPTFGSLKTKDIYFIIRNKFKLHSSSLEVACRELLGETDKTHYNGNIWRRALQGDQEAVGYILEHNKADVTDLEKLTNTVIDFSKPISRSI
jgi:uncharacterized protein YprB with RNaseH-like and TPR domain